MWREIRIFGIKKGDMDYLSKYSGSEIESLLDSSGSSGQDLSRQVMEAISSLISTSGSDYFNSTIGSDQLERLVQACPDTGKVYNYVFPEGMMSSFSYSAISSVYLSRDTSGVIQAAIYADKAFQPDYYNIGFAMLSITEADLSVKWQVSARNEYVTDGSYGFTFMKHGNMPNAEVNDSFELALDSSGDGSKYLGDDGLYHDFPSGGGTSVSYLDLTPLMSDGSTLSDEVYQTVVGAYASGVHLGKVILTGDMLFPISIVKDSADDVPYVIVMEIPDFSTDIMVYKTRISISSDKVVTLTNESITLSNTGDGGMFLSDDGNYKALPKDYLMITKAEVDAGTVSGERGAEIMAALRTGRPILYNNNSSLSETSLLGGIYSLINTYNMFLTEVGTTYLIFFNVNYNGGYGSIVVLTLGLNVSGEYSLSSKSHSVDFEHIVDKQVNLNNVGESWSDSLAEDVDRVIFHIRLSGVTVGQANVSMGDAKTFGNTSYSIICSDGEGKLFKASVSLDGEGKRNVSLTTSYVS